ncbi:hypothetical protein M426DRAFT_323940 [Hypoxylon sp. CI-4A]|nr:hypothetical protein M426DRAFT_323940 [Hypoxylon sp. CI-4A]
MASTSNPFSLQLAERIHNTTSKDKLGYICVGGLACESVWHSVVERNFLKTSPIVVRKAIFRAAVFWPGVFIATKTALRWAEWRVQRAENDA